uniref:Uncharacterized protein n=1 Tax=Solanum lycopersicum TaxID=4081 RepID=K4CL02_SOLLC
MVNSCTKAISFFGVVQLLLSMTIWNDVLFTVNSIRKSLQSKDMHIDVSIDQLRGLVSFLKTYREEGFTSAIIPAKKIALEMNIEPVFRKKHVIYRKNNLMRMLTMKPQDLSKNHLELITSYT